MTASEFFKKCEAHDWFYSMSDDFKVYQRGSNHQTVLMALSQEDQTFVRMYRDFYHWAHGNKIPKPELKNYI